MNLRPDRKAREIVRRPFPRPGKKGRAKAQNTNHRERPVQLVYASLPPAAVLAVEQHLRVQTQIEQRARQLWLAAVSRPVAAANDWLRAEREVVNELCRALRHPDHRPPEPAAIPH